MDKLNILDDDDDEENKDQKLYLQQLEQVLHAASNENKVICLLGDFNIDLSTANNDVSKKNLLHLATSCNLTPNISISTRISTKKSSIIDNIFVNHSEKISLNGVIISELSDHLPVFATLHNSDINQTSKIDIAESSGMKFLFSLNLLSILNNKLLETDWNLVLDCDNVDLAFKRFINVFQQCFYQCCLTNSMKQKNDKEAIMDIR
ncbi:hypothetical protein HELRODRAFT_164302 [Helobdella robusta]|uniref:Endonuclease/exonuclease/phosphatase domain-containing protein n=1 Tax=Helobdella robusta TaxID=6412 RepID=T1EV86_HELRO|nr:hypothetical protein HELRODRAFT_164302 [Helobdella robusta]ESN94456.1 hypothetical protein HELRODRAFT_164302 [Helobdella robusta]